MLIRFMKPVASVLLLSSLHYTRVYATSPFLTQGSSHVSTHVAAVKKHHAQVQRSLSLRWSAEGNSSHRNSSEPKLPISGNLFENIGANPDPKHAWAWVEVRKSKVEGAGLGLFAKCDIAKETLLGEYRGQRFMMGERGSAKQLKDDWAYIWKIPRCLSPPDKTVVLGRKDKIKAHECSNKNGFVYVDAKPMTSATENPLRYVNGAQDEYEAKTLNTEGFFADDRIWYFTTKDVKKGDEFIVDYGDAYWKPARHEGDKAPDDIDADWGNFANDG